MACFFTMRKSSMLTLVMMATMIVSTDAYFHAGLLRVPDFDQIVMYHFPPPASDNYKPLLRPETEQEHLFNLPKFHKAHGAAHHESEKPLGGAKAKFGLTRMNSVNKILVESSVESLGLVEPEQHKQKNLHPGTWLVQEPEDVMDLELEPIGYSRQWIGEEKMGGCWSSEKHPLSGDRDMMLKKFMSLSLEDEEREKLRGLTVTQDADGNVHVMPKKS